MTTQPDATAPPPRHEIISRIATLLRREGFPRGDLAALRRLDAEAPDAPAFWRLLALHGLEPAHLGDDAARRWALIVRGMALMAPNHHDGQVPVGKALHDAAYSEQRLARLLNARGAQFRSLVPRLCRQLAARAQPLNWRELGELILDEGRSADATKRAERLRVDIARTYYSAQTRAAARSA